MTVITGTIKNAAGELSNGMLTVKANKIYGYDGALIDGNEYDVDVVDGVFTTPEIAPGPVKLVVDCGNWRKTFEKVLPDQATIDFFDFIESTIIYEPPVVSTVVQAKDDAIAAKDAAQDILDQVEAGAVPDSAVASKVTDTSSQTRTALNSIYATPASVATAIAPKLDTSVADSAALVATAARFTGLDPTGVANSKTALQAAVDATPNGGKLVIPAGTYKLTTAVAVTDKSISISAYGCTFNCTGAPFAFVGSEETIYTVSAVAASTITNEFSTQAATTLTLSATPPWVRGDVVKLFSDDLVPGGRPGDGTLESRYGQYFVVESVSGTTVVLTGAVRDTCATSVRVSRIPNYSPKLLGGVYNIGGPILFQHLRNPAAVDVHIKKSTAQGMWFSGCYGYRLDNYRIDDAPDITGVVGYGILDNSSAYGTITAPYVGRVRHGYTDDTGRIAAGASGINRYGRSYGNRIIQGVAVGTTNSAWDTHACAEAIQFLDCDAIQCAAGFGIRGRNNLVRGRVIDPSGSSWKVFSEDNTGSESWGHEVDIEVFNPPLAKDVGYVGLNVGTGFAKAGVKETRPTKIRMTVHTERHLPVLNVQNATVQIDKLAVLTKGGPASPIIRQTNSSMFNPPSVLVGSMITSDGFSGADAVSIAGRGTDLEDGGSLLQWTMSPTNRWGIAGGKLVTGSTVGSGFGSLPCTATEVEWSIIVDSIATTAAAVALEIMRDTTDGTAAANSYFVSIGAGVAQLGKKVAGVPTNLGSSVTHAAGDRVGIRRMGSTIYLLVNGATVASATDTAHTTSVCVGISRITGGAVVTGTFDNCQLRTVTVFA